MSSNIMSNVAKSFDILHYFEFIKIIFRSVSLQLNFYNILQNKIILSVSFI